MLIGRLSEKTGVSRKTIRHYESIGLIPAPARKGSYRVYTDNDIAVIKMIKKAQALGFSLAELKELVKQKSDDQHFPVEMACELIDKKQAMLVEDIKRMNLLVEELRALKVSIVETFENGC